MNRRVVSYVLVAIVAVLAMGILAGPIPGAVAQQEGNVVTLTGYVTQYVDDDEAIFTDGRQEVVIEVEGDIKQLPLHQPLTITARVENDDGRLELKVISVEAVSGADAGAAAEKTEAKVPVTTVAEIFAKPVNNGWVALHGQVTQQVGKEKYLFTDGTGTIVLDSDDDAPPLPIGKPMTVFGRVDRDDGQIEIDLAAFVPVDGALVATGDGD